MATTLGDFELLSIAGAGGMGTVHRARSRSGELVAVKVLTPRARADAERFVREAEILAGLRHPSIVRYVAHGATEEGVAYLAMEWLEGEDLSQRLSRGSLSVEESLVVTRQIADALALAHSRGVVHRDIKPGNVFLVGGEATQVRVLDFGIARVAGVAAATRTGTVMGTPGYLAPEQARGERSVEPAADVFALGCVLYECLTGRPAFYAEQLMALLARILLEDPRPPGELALLPRALDELVMRMVAKAPAARPPDGAAVLAALASVSLESVRTLAAPPAQLGDLEHEWLSLVLAREPSPFVTAEAHTLLAAEADTRGRLSAAVESVGASVARLLDGTLVASLPPTAAPKDGALAAARCALTTRATLGHDARVVVVTGRGVRGSRAPLGSLLDQAARLLALPVPSDGPRVDAATAALLDTRFSLGGDAGSLTLRLELPDDEAPRRLLGQPSPCIGRDRELSSLVALFDESASEGLARAVLLTAPPGSGKSRLRIELSAQLAARADPPSIWIARGDAMSAGSPNGLLIQIVRSAAGLHDGEPAELLRTKLTARVARHVPAEDASRVAAFLGELTGVPFSDDGLPALRGARRDPVALGDQIAVAWEDFLAAELRAGQVVLVLEDLHWGDLPTVRAVDRALRRLKDSPLFVVATARPEVHDLFPGLWADRALQEVRLGPLTPRASERLVRGALGARATDDLVARIVVRAEGNPFLLEELIRAADAGEELSDTVLAMTSARLGALPDACRRVLRAASVFGETFWREGVRALVGSDVVETAIARLLDAEIVEPRPQSRFEGTSELRFRHALLRDAAHAALTPEDLAIGHRLAGRWLEGAGERDDLVLAEHFERGGDSPHAATFYARAAERALEGNDFAAVVRHAERALARGGGAAGESVCHRLIADAQQWLGNYDAGLAAARRATELFPGGSSGWFRSILFQAICLQRLGQMGEVIALAARVAEVVPSSGAEGVRIEVLVRLAMRLNFFAHSPLVPVLLDLAESESGSDDDATLGWLDAARGVRAHVRGDLPVYIAHTSRAAELLERAGKVRDALSQREDLGWWWQHCGEFAKAEAETARVIGEAERLGLRRVETNARIALVWQAVAGGRLEEGIAAAERVLQSLEGTADRAVARFFLGWGLSEAGRFERATEELAAVRVAQVRGSGYWRVATGRLGEALVGMGDLEGARAIADELSEVLGGAVTGEHFEIEARCSLASIRLALGEEEAARAAAEKACEHAFKLVGGFSDRAARTRALRRVGHHVKAIGLARRLGVVTPLLDDA